MSVRRLAENPLLRTAWARGLCSSAFQRQSEYAQRVKPHAGGDRAIGIHFVQLHIADEEELVVGDRAGGDAVKSGL